MNEPHDPSIRELQQKLEQIMKHGDPDVQTMMGDLIREFHNQLMDDPKSRAGMKEQQKALRALGEKIIQLPYFHQGEEDDEDSPPETIPIRRPRRKGWLVLLAVALLALIVLTGKWVISTDQAPPVRTCDIKGNINEQEEKIYHLPGTKWYADTFIDEARGERWFCSEAEAEAAGWRQSLRDAE